jgi:hypothetical protein
MGRGVVPWWLDSCRGSGHVQGDGGGCATEDTRSGGEKSLAKKGTAMDAAWLVQS